MSEVFVRFPCGQTVQGVDYLLVADEEDEILFEKEGVGERELRDWVFVHLAKVEVGSCDCGGVVAEASDVSALSTMQFDLCFLYESNLDVLLQQFQVEDHESPTGDVSSLHLTQGGETSVHHPQSQHKC